MNPFYDLQYVNWEWPVFVGLPILIAKLLEHYWKPPRGPRVK